MFRKLFGVKNACDEERVRNGMNMTLEGKASSLARTVAMGIGRSFPIWRKGSSEILECGYLSSSLSTS
jgi:hypothetical protein